MSTAIAFQELAATAAILCKEITLCNRLAHALRSEQWDSEQVQLVANTHASSIAQIFHCQRALLLEALEVENDIFLGNSLRIY